MHSCVSTARYTNWKISSPAAELPAEYQNYRAAPKPGNARSHIETVANLHCLYIIPLAVSCPGFSTRTGVLHRTSVASIARSTLRNVSGSAVPAKLPAASAYIGLSSNASVGREALDQSRRSHHSITLGAPLVRAQSPRHTWG